MISGIILFLGVFGSLRGQTTFVNDIDRELEDCLNNDFSTVGMASCYASASEKWDVELNKYYKFLRDILNEEEFEKLRQTQRAWLIYRDNDYQFRKYISNKLGGSMRSFINVQSAMEIIKERALSLQNYYLEISDSRGLSPRDGKK